ncbi:MAG: hypothetical protein PVH11_06695 [Anaerolineae bacterium]
MGATTAIAIAGLGILWLVLLFLTFYGSDAPNLLRLFFFQCLLAVSGILLFLFLVRVVGWNPNPSRVSAARFLTKDRMIYLGDIVPGVFDLDYIYRLDAGAPQERAANGEESLQDWIVLYQYDVVGAQSDRPVGPYGAAIYEPDACRPPVILSFELVPASYDYLAQDQIWVGGDLEAPTSDLQVRNIVDYGDPASGGLDRPEVIIFGRTGNVRTDLNIFRKVGMDTYCLPLRDLRPTPTPSGSESTAMTLTTPFEYQNIGSFRGSYRVALGDPARAKDRVTVWDRAGFERSQFTAKRVYAPQNGSYFLPGSTQLVEPLSSGLDFGPGWPDNLPQVYYPEKAVLAFYLSLTTSGTDLSRAESYLSDEGRQRYDAYRDQFGLALPRREVGSVLVWEICYSPDVAAEQAHADREVRAVVVAVDRNGQVDSANPQVVRWKVIGDEDPSALPYGCEWKLDTYESLGPGSTCSGR